MSRLLEGPCAGAASEVPFSGGRCAGAAAGEVPAVGAGRMGRGHVPAGFHAGCAPIARCQDQTQGAVVATCCPFFGGEMQAAHRGEGGWLWQVGDDERGRAAAQRLFHAPQEILASLWCDEDQALWPVLGPGEGADAIGVEVVACPCGGNPEHGAAQSTDEEHRKAVAGGAGAFVLAGERQVKRAQKAEGGAMAVTGEKWNRHGQRIACSLNVLNRGANSIIQISVCVP